MTKFKTLLFILLFVSIGGFAQTQSSTENQVPKTINGVGNNELKINLAMCVAGLPEITYERYIAENMGIGLSASISVDNTQDYNAILLPYYRLYFGNKLKTAFFIEGSMAVVTERPTNDFYSYSYPYQSIPTTSSTNFGFGVAAGVKFLTKNNFIGELYLGAGRIFGNSNSGGFPRVGLTIGKRF